MKSSYASNRRSSRRLVSVVILALLLAVTAVAPQSLQAVEVDQPYVGAAAVGTFSNTTAITWPDNTGGNASTFPSTITVSALTGNITKVTVTLNNVSHSRPDDFDILLRGPQGGGVLIWSDACGGEGISGLNMTFEDGFATLPDTRDATTGPCVGGTYGPTDYDPGEALDGSGPTGTTFGAAFTGTAPNGVWSLYVVDDRTGSVGSIAGGWSITITTEDVANTPPTIAAIADQPMTTGTTLDLTLSATDPDVGDVVTFGATSSDAGVATAVVAGNTLTLTAVAAGTAVITVTATDGTAAATPVTFNVIVTDPVPGVPVINPISDQNMLVGATLNVPISATDPDSDPLTYGASSSDGAIVTAAVSGTDVVLNAVAAGSATITVTVSDGANTATETFLVTVTTEPVQPTPGAPGTPQPAPSGPIYSAEDHRRAQAPLCADLGGQTNPAVRASVPDGAVPGGTVNCRVLAQDGVFPNPIDSARVGDPGLITYGIISAVDVFGVNSNGFADPTFEHAVTVCLQGSGRFIYLSALNSPRTTFEMASFVEGDYTCASIPAAGTVVLIPPQPMN